MQPEGYYAYRFTNVYGDWLTFLQGRNELLSSLKPGKIIHLTPVETRLVETLIMNPNQIFPFSLLIERALMPEDIPKDDYTRLKSHFSHIRNHVADERIPNVPRRFRFFNNVTGTGYTLNPNPLSQSSSLEIFDVEIFLQENPVKQFSFTS